VLLRDAMLYATERIGLTHLAVFLVSGRDGIYTTARGASERSTHTTRPIREARKMRLYFIFGKTRKMAKPWQTRRYTVSALQVCSKGGRTGRDRERPALHAGAD
jgi:hypothetical protein